MKFPFGEKHAMHALLNFLGPLRAVFLLPFALRLLGLRFGQSLELMFVRHFPVAEIVPPQLPLLIILSLVLELDTGFRQELLKQMLLD